MGSRTVSVLLSIKLITATAAIMAPAAVKILILRITLSFNRKFCGYNQQDPLSSVNIGFDWSGRRHSRSLARPGASVKSWTRPRSPNTRALQLVVSGQLYRTSMPVSEMLQTTLDLGGRNQTSACRYYQTVTPAKNGPNSPHSRDRVAAPHPPDAIWPLQDCNAISNFTKRPALNGRRSRFLRRGEFDSTLQIPCPGYCWTCRSYAQS